MLFRSPIASPHAPVEHSVRAPDYRKAEMPGVQVDGQYSCMAVVLHTTKEVINLGASRSRCDTHWNFCAIALAPLATATCFRSRVCSFAIRPRASLATESLRPANNSDTGTPKASWQASAVRKDGCRAFLSYLERSDLSLSPIRKETSLWLSPECLRWVNK